MVIPIAAFEEASSFLGKYLEVTGAPGAERITKDITEIFGAIKSVENFGEEHPIVLAVGLVLGVYVASRFGPLVATAVESYSGIIALAAEIPALAPTVPLLQAAIGTAVDYFLSTGTEETLKLIDHFSPELGKILNEILSSADNFVSSSSIVFPGLPSDWDLSNPTSPILIYNVYDQNLNQTGIAVFDDSVSQIAGVQSVLPYIANETAINDGVLSISGSALSALHLNATKFTNDGTVLVTNGSTLSIETSVGNSAGKTGSIEIISGAVEIHGAVGFGQTIDLVSNATLKLDAPANVSGSIKDFGVGDTIEVDDAGTVSSATVSSSNVLSLHTPNGVINLQLAAGTNLSGGNLFVSTDGSGGSLISLNAPPVTAVPSGLLATTSQATPLHGISVADLDAQTANETFSVVLSDATGVLSANAVSGATIAGSGTNKLTVTGSETAVNAELATLTYLGASNKTSDTIDVATSDGRGGSDDDHVSVSTSNLYAYKTIPLPAVPNSVVTAGDINFLGEIVGSVYNPTTNTSTAFFYDGTSLSSVAAPGSTITVANGITDEGRIFGYYRDTLGEQHGFIEINGSFQTIDFPGATSTQIINVTPNGQIVGQITDGTGAHDFTDNSGSFRKIDIPISIPGVNGATNITINNVTDSNELIGSFTDANGFHSFTDVDGSISVFDVPGDLNTSIREISTGDETIGRVVDNAGARGFVDIRGNIVYISVPDASGEGTYPQEVDQSGRILGLYFQNKGTFPGFSAGFVATPNSGSEIAVSIPGPQPDTIGNAQAIPDISISDSVHAGATFSATVAGSHGTLALTHAASGSSVITSSIDHSNATITGSLSDVNADLAALTFTGTVPGAAAISVAVSDSSSTSAIETTTVLVSAPLSPVIVLPPNLDALTGSPTPLLGLEIVDANANPTLAVTVSGSHGTLSADGSAGAVKGSGTSTVTFSGSLAVVNADIASLSFTGNEVGSGSLQIQANDGVAPIATETTPITVEGISPALSGASANTAGTNSSDVLVGTGAADVIFGNEGNDNISVTNGNDLIVDGAIGVTPTSAENDTISAGDGNNTIYGGAGAGSIIIGDGNNLIINHYPTLTTGGNSSITLGAGTNIVFAVSGNDTIAGGDGTTVINGGSGSVSITGGAGLTLMSGGTAGASTLDAGNGPTEILSTSGRNSIVGGSGGDTILAAGGTSSSGGDTVRAGAGNDLIIMTAGSGTLYTNLGSGHVTINAGGFSAANQTKTITLGTGASSIVFGSTVSGSFAATDIASIIGYKTGTDHITLQGLSEHSLSALTIVSSGANTNITIADVGTIQLIGIASNHVGSADFTFA